MKGTTNGKVVAETAAVAVGLCDRGIGLQAIVFMPGAEDFDTVTVYLNDIEASELIRKLQKTVYQYQENCQGQIQEIIR